MSLASKRGREAQVLLTDSVWANEARSRTSQWSSFWVQTSTGWRSALAKHMSTVACAGWSGSSAHVLKEMWSECWGDPMEHAVDASTGKSIFLRSGQGGMKHLDITKLWVQEAITEKSIRVLKMNREENPADTFASYSDAQVMQKRVRMMGCEVD